MKRKFDNNIIESKRDSINAAISLYPKQSKHILYGTAGFRDDVSVPLQPVFLRVGILAAIRSLHKSSEIVGVMITASHNPEQDNGVKMIDNDGGMLDQQWEKYAEELANAPEADFFNVLQSALDSLELNSIKNNVAPVVFIGRDTRPHSLMLSRCVQQGIESVGGITVDLEEVTTPQLHYIVGTCNINEITVTAKILPDINKLKELYLQNFASSYLKLIENTEPNSSDVKLHDLVVDASNGVGSITLMELLLIIDSASTYKSGRRDYSAVDVRNAARCGLVNDDCGAEHVQKGVRPPLGVNAAKDFGKLLCSFDGDADRIVFHSFLSADGPWVLMDGDKIAALFTVFLQGEMKHLSAGDDDLAPNINRLRFGVVQTAYANGSSTKFFKDRNILVSMAKTGVKYLHRKAHEDFDIGVYFEANGHGTILFSDAFLKVINHAVNNMEQYESRKQLAIQRLHTTTRLVNQMIGDAISDLLLSLACLQLLEMSVEQWHGLYSDLPSKMIKVPVRDKNLIKCSDDETAVLSPAALQTQLNQVMAASAERQCRGRVFVRPSGTEDVVRVYAEAVDLAEVEALLKSAVDAISQHVV